MKLQTLAIATSLLILPFASMAGDIAAGKAKSMTCSACHGADGKAVIPTYPNLAGQNEQYLVQAIKAYKNGQRTGGQAAIMAGMAAALNDADIANLAAYYSSLK